MRIQSTALSSPAESSASNYSRFRPTPGSSLDEIRAVLAVARIGVADPDRFIAEHGPQSAVESLREVGLLGPGLYRTFILSPGVGVPTTFTTQQPNILKPTTLLMLAKPCERRRVETLSLRPPSIPVDLRSGWLDFVLEELPEVAAFTEWFDRDTTGEVDSAPTRASSRRWSAKGLQTRKAFSIRSWPSVDSQELSLRNTTRIPRHHTGSTGAVSAGTQETTGVVKCGAAPIPEVQFCRKGTCHEPYVAVDNEEEEKTFASIRGDGTGGCPGCGGSFRLTDIGVPTSSLLSYMLSEVCRVAPSNKTLVFGLRTALLRAWAKKSLNRVWTDGPDGLPPRVTRGWW